MKTKSLLLTKLLLLLFFSIPLIFLFRMQANAEEPFHFQEYNGVNYDTEEDKEKLEKILRADGYICVSAWCTDNEEATDYLRDYELFCLSEQIDYPHAKIFVSADSLKSMLDGGFDNLDTVMIDTYSTEEEAQNLEGKIARNFTTNPIESGADGTGTLTIQSIVNEEILEKYAYTKGTFIFTSIDTNKDFEIDLNAANSFSALVTVPDGNYTVKSVFLGTDCAPSVDISTFTVAGMSNVNPILTFDFTVNWVSEGEEKENEELLTLKPSDETISELSVSPDVIEKKNWVPMIVTFVSLGFFLIVIIIVVAVIRKKTRNTSV